MAEDYRQSLEWQALNRIWKTVPQQARDSVKADFKLLSDMIKPVPAPAPAVAAKEDEANYLSGMSPAARKLAVKNLTKDNFNIYAYLMELIPRSKAGSEEELWDAYISEREDGEENEEALRDMMGVCVARARERGIIH